METLMAQLRREKGNYESHHSVTIEESALQAAAVLAGRFLATEEFQSVVTLVDEAAMEVRLARLMSERDSTAEEPRTVTAIDVARVVARRTGRSLGELLEP